MSDSRENRVANPLSGRDIMELSGQFWHSIKEEENEGSNGDTRS
jgi:hypothetical protein